MRIGVDLSCLETAKTGVGTYATELTSAIEAAGEHQLIRLAPGSDSGLPRSRLSKLLRHGRHQAWVQHRLPFEAAAVGCDVLLGPEYEIPLRSTCPAVPVFHDAAFWTQPELYNPVWLLLMNRLVLPAARAAPAVITVSEHSRHELIQRLDLPHDRVHVVYSAARKPVDPAPEALSLFGLRRQGYFLHVGVLEKRKNLVRLVRAFHAATRELAPEISLVLCGQPAPKSAIDATHQILETVRSLGLEKRVHLIGYQPSDVVAGLYSDAIATVIPSLLEGFGLPLLESFSYDTPVLSSTAGALPEISAGAALHFDPLLEDAISAALVEIAHDDRLRETLVEKGRQRLGRFTWENTARATVEVLRGAVAC